MSYDRAAAKEDEEEPEIHVVDEDPEINVDPPVVEVKGPEEDDGVLGSQQRYRRNKIYYPFLFNFPLFHNADSESACSQKQQMLRQLWRVVQWKSGGTW